MTLRLIDWPNKRLNDSTSCERTPLKADWKVESERSLTELWIIQQSQHCECAN